MFSNEGVTFPSIDRAYQIFDLPHFCKASDASAPVPLSKFPNGSMELPKGKCMIGLFLLPSIVKRFTLLI
jgi:hypothetical protein